MIFHRRAVNCIAFTLVEVVLAIGVVSFGLVSVITLLSLAMQSSKESSEDTNIALMTQTIVALLRSNGYTNVTGTIPAGSASSISYYFDARGGISLDESGKFLTSTTVATATTPPVYICTVTNKTSASPAPNFPPAGFPLRFAQLQFDFSWPYGAPAANRQHKYVATSLAQYD